MVSSESTREAELNTTSHREAKHVHGPGSIYVWPHVRIAMALFQYGFRHVSANSAAQRQQLECIPVQMPTIEGSGRVRVEYESTTTSVSELAYPTPAAKKRKTRGKYLQYTPEQCAHISRICNERARPRFFPDLPDVKESTIRNFKRAYKERMYYQQKQLYPQPVIAITAQLRGILLGIDKKLIRAVRTKVGVMNIQCRQSCNKSTHCK